MCIMCIICIGIEKSVYFLICTVFFFWLIHNIVFISVYISIKINKEMCLITSWKALLNRFIDVLGNWVSHSKLLIVSWKRTFICSLSKIQLVQELNSRNGTQNWPPRSRDLNFLEFFFWGYIKSKVYVNNPQIIEKLKEEIRIKIADVDQDLCGRPLQNFVEQVDVWHRVRSDHLSDIFFFHKSKMFAYKIKK